jgi:hypothetical protein
VVPRKERGEPHRALGWIIMIDVKTSGQYKTLHNKTQQFVSAIYRSRMRPHDAYIAYICYYVVIVG